MQIMLFILAGMVLGMMFPVQASVSARLSSYSRTPLIASLVAFVLGGSVLLVLNMVINPSFFSQIPQFFNLPWYVLLGGGISGLLYNIANIMLFRELGASITTVVTLTGQMIMGLLIDHFALFGAPQTSLSTSRVIGVLIMMIAVSFSSINRNIPQNGPSVKSFWVVIGTLAGILPPLQQVFNGQLSREIGTPLGASLISFSVGLLLLLGIILLVERQIKIPRYDESHKKLPLWYYMGGLFGVFIVTGNILLLPSLGSVLTVMVAVLGQLLMSLMIDEFGLFGLAKRKIDRQQLVTIGLTVVGIIFVKFL